jgi:HK97 family phage prohead protease
MTMERKELLLPFADVGFKAVGEGGYKFEGYASKFNTVDSYGDTILPGAYKQALIDIKKSGRPLKMFFNHKAWELPIGKFNKTEEDEVGLFVCGELTKGMSMVEDLKLALAAGTVDGLSVGIGMKSDDYEWVSDPKSSIQRIIKNISVLRETSVVTFPAEKDSRIDMSSIKAELDDVKSIQDLERFLREAGSFSKTAAEAVVSRAKAILRGDPETMPEQKQAEEVAELLKGFQLPSFGS